MELGVGDIVRVNEKALDTGHTGVIKQVTLTEKGTKYMLDNQNMCSYEHFTAESLDLIDKDSNQLKIDDYKVAVNNQLEDIRDLEDTIEYMDNQLELMARAVSGKNEIIDRLNEIIKDLTD